MKVIDIEKKIRDCMADLKKMPADSPAVQFKETEWKAWTFIKEHAGKNVKKIIIIVLNENDIPTPEVKE